MSSSGSDASHVCRTCLTNYNSSEYLTEVFQKISLDGEILELRAILETCTKLQINRGEEFLPHSLCKDCVTKLSRSYSFQKQCWEADSILRYEHEKLAENNVNGVIEFLKQEDFSEDDTDETVQTLKNEDDFIKSEEVVIEMVEEFEFDKIQIIENENSEDLTEDYQIECLDKFEEHLDSIDIEYANLNESIEIVNSQNSNSKSEKKKSGIQKGNGSDFEALCPYCGLVSTNKNQYACHLRQKHKTEKGEENHIDMRVSIGDYICSVCGRKFKENYCLTKHMITHTTPPQIPCEICGKLLRTKNVLTQHMKIHSENKPYKCNICGASKVSQVELNTHMRFHTGERPFKCSICDKAFITTSHRISHERTHSLERVICKICNRDFKSKVVLRKHTITHFPDQYPKCLYCEKTFPTAKQRKGHMKTDHPEYKQICCQMCGKKFMKQETYDRHYRMNHLLDIKSNEM